MTHSTSKWGHGFTLLELLIALSIFALIAMMAYGGLLSILRVDVQIATTTQQLTRLQFTFQRFQQDVSQLIYRPIRNEYGDSVPAIQATMQQIELTRTGWRNPLQQPRSQLQRVNYSVEKQTLWRTYWQVLDRTRDSQPQRTALLTDVTVFKLRFLDNQALWHDEWSSAVQTQLAGKSLQLKAIEVNLSLEGWGEIIWLFPTTAPPSLPKLPNTSTPSSFFRDNSLTIAQIVLK
jgi:general secretion pathway protein J